MSTLYLDEEKIRDQIIPNIQNAIKKINNAISVGKLKVPENFEYYTYLSGLHNKNYNSAQSLITKQNQINDFIKKYNDVEAKNLEGFEEIQILDLLPRDALNK